MIKASAKRANKHVTGDEFENAVEACIDELDPKCSTVQTLTLLYSLVDDAGILRFDRAAPVTLAEFDAALDAVQGIVRPKVLATLKTVRAQLGQAVDQAQAAAAAADAEPLFITRKQHAAALDAMGAALGVAAECFSETNFTKGNLIGALSRAADAAPEPMASSLNRIVRAVCNQKTPPRVPESDQDRLYRMQHGRARPR